MRVANTVRAAGASDPGLQRNHNEDRCHWDEQRGIFLVVDGVGGQAAGEKAADTALAKLRDRLERQTGRIEDRIREAIAIANDEIFRLASIRPEWKGMACVLTVAVVDNGDVVVGHVGDTRLYKVRRGRLQKLTRDHSPVGEREDARELSEQEAMRHPRRNEVFRDVGSEPHDPDDPDFIDIERVPFERDAALLLCTDGLTDSVDSATIGTIVDTFAGHPADVVRELIESANDAGGKDNVSVVYVEGDQFTGSRQARVAVETDAAERPAGDLMLRLDVPAADHAEAIGARVSSAPKPSPVRRMVTWAVVILLLAVIAAALLLERGAGMRLLREPLARFAGGQRAVVRVGPSDSIATALAGARPGTDVVVEPGEYREAVTLPPGVRLVSRVPRGATLRLSGTASDNEAVVTASGVSGAQLVGFRIVGDAATPVGIGIYSERSDLEIIDVEISGAKNAAVEFGRGSTGTLLASDLINNFGSALIVRAGGAPRISHNRFARNATAEASPPVLILEASTTARFIANIFEGLRADSFPQLKDGNVFLALPAPQTPPPAASGRRGHR
jgi:serine/threonine protein phosphatase PrpC